MTYNPGYVDGKLVANNAAYVPGAGMMKILDNVEGGATIWLYTTSDSLAAVQASGYVTDATFKRMKVGDLVLVMSGTLVNESAASPQGAVLGAVTFPATIGVPTNTGLGLFTTVPQIQWMMVGSVTAPTTTTSGAATLVAADPSVFNFSANPRNLLDAADFTTNPWQLGTSFNGGATAKLTADRWAAIGGTSSVWVASQVTQTSAGNGMSAAYQWGRSAGDTHSTGLTFGQVVETADSIRLQGLPLALSFWEGAGANFAAGASGGIVTVGIIAGTGINDTFANMVAGSWTGATTIATGTFTPGTTAAPLNRVVGIGGTVPTNCTQLGVAFSYQPSAGTTAGANEWVQFQGPQLEVGGTTPFEHLDVAEVVNICTRYLQVISEPTVGIAIGPAAFSASSIAQVHIPLASPLRKAPTLTFTPGGYAIVDSALGAHTISAGGLQGATTGSITLLVTAATTLSAGLVEFMQGRSTGLGTINLDADYA